jgi:hypothetical protein
MSGKGIVRRAFLLTESKDLTERKDSIMKPTLDKLRANFDPYAVPYILEELLAFQNISLEYYAGYFELDLVTRDDLKYHIREDALPQFFGFGREGDDSLYALWRYKEMPLEEAPVVYLNSEGEGSGVQASNLAEFFTLLATDQDPAFGRYAEQSSQDREQTKRNPEFLRWLEQRYHLHEA